MIFSYYVMMGTAEDLFSPIYSSNTSYKYGVVVGFCGNRTTSTAAPPLLGHAAVSCDDQFILYITSSRFELKFLKFGNLT